MSEADDAAFRARLEQMGEAAVTVAVERRTFTGDHKALAQEWLYDKAFARAATAQERADLALNTAQRSAAAAERAADASEATAKAATKSATWAFWTAIVALVAVLVSVLRDFLIW